ncbi:MAG: hypothetical protein AB7F32_05030 [Victivallaceae bacterium]
MADAINQRWDDFRAVWNAYFKPLNKEEDGEAEWFKFICHRETDLGAVRKAVTRLAAKHASHNENPRYAGKPKLGALKFVYWAIIKEDKAKEKSVAHGGGTVCGTCFGAGLVYVLAPRRSDWEKRVFWPEDFRIFSMDDCTGFETARCPDCSENYWSDERRRRVAEHSLPITVPRGFRDFPTEWDMPAASGAQVMAWHLQRNFER